MTTTSAMPATLVSALALAMMPRSRALRSVMESVSLPTITMSGRTSFKARANDEPMSPSPTTATVVTAMSAAAPRSAAYFAASAAGGKERVALGGAHPWMRDDAAPGPLTPPSAPQAPGRLGREDARSLGAAAL